MVIELLRRLTMLSDDSTVTRVVSAGRQILGAGVVPSCSFSLVVVLVEI
jgi:hypothetical protein